MPAAIITKSLDSGDCSESSDFGINDSFEKGVQDTVGTMTELGEIASQGSQVVTSPSKSPIFQPLHQLSTT